MYGLQHRIKTEIMTNVILMVLTLAFGMRPREEARRVSSSVSPSAPDGLGGREVT
jgi:hypothetical protein